MLLLLKLILVPILIALVTIAARRWGTRVAGLVMALPVVAGPTLCFYAIEQGHAFAADAARTTLLGLVAVAGFCFVYARSATRCHWLASLILGWLTFGLVTAALYRTQLNLVASLAAAVTALLAARALLPAPRAVPPAGTPPPWDLPLRMLAAAALVFALTSAAARLGPGLSGVLTPFPIATAIIAGFTHAQRGPDAVAQFLRGYIPALCSFAVFCFVLSIALRSLDPPAAFAAALAAQFAVQAVILWRTTAKTRGETTGGTEVPPLHLPRRG